MKITFDVDPRTASALMRFYKREMKERYNHE